MTTSKIVNVAITEEAAAAVGRGWTPTEGLRSIYEWLDEHGVEEVQPWPRRSVLIKARIDPDIVTRVKAALDARGVKLADAVEHVALNTDWPKGDRRTRRKPSTSD